MASADDIIDQLQEQGAGLYILLEWNSEEERWDLEHTCEDREELAAGLSHILFELALGEH